MGSCATPGWTAEPQFGATRPANPNTFSSDGTPRSYSLSHISLKFQSYIINPMAQSNNTNNCPSFLFNVSFPFALTPPKPVWSGSSVLLEKGHSSLGAPSLPSLILATCGLSVRLV